MGSLWATAAVAGGGSGGEGSLILGREDFNLGGYGGGGGSQVVGDFDLSLAGSVLSITVGAGGDGGEPGLLGDPLRDGSSGNPSYVKQFSTASPTPTIPVNLLVAMGGRHTVSNDTSTSGGGAFGGGATSPDGNGVSQGTYGYMQNGKQSDDLSSGAGGGLPKGQADPASIYPGAGNGQQHLHLVEPAALNIAAGGGGGSAPGPIAAVGGDGGRPVFSADPEFPLEALVAASGKVGKFGGGGGGGSYYSLADNATVFLPSPGAKGGDGYIVISFFG